MFVTNKFHSNSVCALRLRRVKLLSMLITKQIYFIFAAVVLFVLFATFDYTRFTIEFVAQPSD